MGCGLEAADAGGDGPGSEMSAGSSTHCRLLLGSGSPALSADELGRPDKARDLHERALRIEEPEYGPDHVEVARTLTNLGNA